MENYTWVRKKTRKTKQEIKKLNNESNKVLMLAKNMATRKKLLNEFKLRMTEKVDTTSDTYYKYKYKYNINTGEKYGRYKIVLPCGKEVVILDKEKLSKPYKYWGFSSFELSSDEKFLIFAVDYAGDQIVKLYYKNYFEDNIHEIKNPSGYKIASYHSYGGDAAISTNSQNIIYLTVDKSNRSNRVWVVNMSDLKKHYCIHIENRETYSLQLCKTTDNEYNLISSISKSTNNIYIIKNDNSIQYVLKEREGLKFDLDHFNNIWYFLLIDDTKTEIVYSETLYGKKQVLVPYDKSRYIYKMIIKANYMLVLYKVNGNKNLVKISLCDHSVEQLVMPDVYYTLTFPYFANLNVNSQMITIKYNSMLNPPITIKYDLVTGKNNATITTIPHYNKNNYAEENVIVNKAGARIIMLYNKNKIRLMDGPHKCILYVYGAYGVTHPALYNKSLQSLLDRGFIFCYAFIRGGGYYGKRWYNDGKLLNKMNTFYDCIDCAKYLINKNYTASDRLTLWGRSAGGLTVGAVINMAPELFNFAILGVPFVDVITEMMDKNTPLTTEEYEEWGNPNKKQIYNYMSKYCPYKNIDLSLQYPNIYIYSNYKDSLVGYWVPMKYYLKIKEASIFKNGERDVLMKLNMKYGHSQSSNRYEKLKEDAEIYSLIIHYNP